MVQKVELDLETPNQTLEGTQKTKTDTNTYTLRHTSTKSQQNQTLEGTQKTQEDTNMYTLRHTSTKSQPT